MVSVVGSSLASTPLGVRIVTICRSFADVSCYTLFLYSSVISVTSVLFVLFVEIFVKVYMQRF